MLTRDIKKSVSLLPSNTVCEKQEVKSENETNCLLKWEKKREHTQINQTTKSDDQKRESDEWVEVTKHQMKC